MCTINSITITADASKNYQKYSVSVSAENIQQEDFETLKNLTISEALKGVNEMAAAIGNTDSAPAQVKTTTSYGNIPRRETTSQQRYYSSNSQQNNNTYNNGGYNGYNPNNDTRVSKPASEKQLNYIRSFGYTGVMPTSFLEADELLKRLKGGN